MAEATYTSNVDTLLEAMKAGIENGVSEAVERVAAKARQYCPVGTEEKSRRRFYYQTYATKRERKKAGTKWVLNDSGRRTRVGTRWGKGWTARRPGTLRDSIFTRVRWMKDGSGDCVGWVKAGADGTPDGSGFYAPYVEWGTAKMQAKPFMRPALRGMGGKNGAILTDIAYNIGLELGQVSQTGVKRRVYGV